ncbi:Ankyrin repeat domain-containing protein, partial [Tetrabaena socialis]
MAPQQEVEQQAEGVAVVVDDPSRVWLPELVQRFAGLLSGNEVACVLRLVNKAAAAQFSRPQDRTVRLSLRVPHHAFAWRWGGAGAMRSLNRSRRRLLPCLTARSGSITNLELLLARGGSVPVLEGQVLDAAAQAGQLTVCRWLRQQGCPFSRPDGRALLDAAAGGQQAVCEWLLASGCPWCDLAAGEATRGGHVGLVDWLLGAVPDSVNVESLLKGAAAGCDLPTLQRLHHNVLGRFGAELENEHARSMVVASAAASPRLDWRAKVEWLEGRGYARRAAAPQEVARLADGRGRLQWLLQRGYPLNANVAESAAAGGNVDVLRLVLDSGVVMDVRHACSTIMRAAEEGHVAVLQVLLPADESRIWSARDAAAAAAGNGHLPVLTWLVETLGATVLSTWVFVSATKSGSMELLAWLHEHGCPWEESVFAEAAAVGSEEELEWLAVHGCPMVAHGDPYLQALRNGGRPMMHCLRRLGCPWGPHGHVFTYVCRSLASTATANRDALPTLRFLLEEGCSVDWVMALRAARTPEVVAWLQAERQR